MGCLGIQRFSNPKGIVSSTKGSKAQLAPALRQFTPEIRRATERPLYSAKERLYFVHDPNRTRARQLRCVVAQDNMFLREIETRPAEGITKIALDKLLGDGCFCLQVLQHVE